MRNQVIRIFFFIILSQIIILLFLTSISVRAKAEYRTRETTINCTSDAFVRQDYPDDNFGSKPYFLVGAEENHSYETYMSFDLTSLTTLENITATYLEITVYYAPRDVSVRANLIEGAWDEYSITWNNKPSKGAFIGALTVVQCSDYTLIVYALDVTSEVSGKSEISICLSSPYASSYVQGYGKSYSGLQLHIMYSEAYELDEKDETNSSDDDSTGSNNFEATLSLSGIFMIILSSLIFFAIIIFFFHIQEQKRAPLKPSNGLIEEGINQVIILEGKRIPLFKLIYIIIGLISFILPWLTIRITTSTWAASLDILADYNFLGLVTNLQSGSVSYDVSDYWQANDLTPFGTTYLIGFTIALFHYKAGDIEKNKELGLIGLILMCIGLIGYAWIAFYKIEDAINSTQDLQGSGVSSSISAFLHLGFYCAMISIVFLLLELAVKQQPYIKLNEDLLDG